MPADGARQNKSFEIAAAGNQILNLIAMRDARFILLDDRPIVEASVT